MKKHSHQKGFTLIELLVVVAIIGILATVVLASLGDARDNAKDAKIKATLSAMRAQSELQYDGDYDDVCDSTSVSGKMYRDAYEDREAGTATMRCIDQDSQYYGNSGTLAGPTGTSEFDSNNSAWGAMIALNGGGFFCVDSLGNAKEMTTGVIVQNPSVNKTCN